jgi:hypothetical protein
MPMPWKEEGAGAVINKKEEIDKQERSARLFLFLLFFFFVFVFVVSQTKE